jgi:glyoxylase-like metal-dependent hydrolase (beta-lactamase superfamily II)
MKVSWFHSWTIVDRSTRIGHSGTSPGSSVLPIVTTLRIVAVRSGCGVGIRFAERCSVAAVHTLAGGSSWFERRRVDDSVTLLWEPYVVELMRCNIWHVRGRDRDLIVDTGMGVSSLVDELGSLIDKPVVAVATHGHDDHIGGHHEFGDVRVHPLELDALRDPPLYSLDPRIAWGDDGVGVLAASGYELGDSFVTALPPGVVFETFRQHPVTDPRPVVDGDVIDLGDRSFEVLHLPGHSPGSIGLWEPGTGTLFSGDAVYDGPLLDMLPESDIADYCATMRRLLELPVEVVHGGHDPSFGRPRLHEIAGGYLARNA